MRNGRLTGQSRLLYLLGLIPAIWLGLLIAPSMTSGGLPALIKNLSEILNRPFHIVWCEGSVKAALIAILCYGTGIGCYLSTARNYRIGEEHGSAKWGIAEKLNQKYMSKDARKSKILSSHVSIGLNGRIHRRNLNVLVCGGSGAGKTRFYAKPNIMQANTSYVVLDPKGELLESTGNLLESEGYEIKVLDLIHPELSHCYNPFVYLRGDADIQKLVSNIFKNTTPKDAKSSEPFWDSTAALLLKALISYLFYEAPPEEQNFTMVMDMIHAGDVMESNEAYQSPLDCLFDRLHKKKPDHIAYRYYTEYHSAAGKTMKSIQITLISHLEKFNISSVRALCQTDEMNLPDMGKKKTALFALIPENDSSLNFIVGMLYTQLFQQLYEVAKDSPGGRLPIHVHFVMDEFANVNYVAMMRIRNFTIA